jgi:hypothetical protein
MWGVSEKPNKLDYGRQEQTSASERDISLAVIAFLTGLVLVAALLYWFINHGQR